MDTEVVKILKPKESHGIKTVKSTCRMCHGVCGVLVHIRDGKVIEITGGHGIQRKLHVMGIREGQEIKICSKQPFKGPITIGVCGSQITLGRGMAQKIQVEVI